MSVNTSLSEDNDAFVISVKGEFDFSMFNSFRDAYTNLVELTASTRIVIDMRDTSSINSSALGMLLNMQRYLNKADGEIEIINANYVVKRVFNITQFDSKFKIE